MAGLYASISNDITGLWTPNWSHSATVVPVSWRNNDLDVLIDPSQFSWFVRNEITFGAERILAFGGGRTRNQKVQFGAVTIRVFSARDIRSETAGLDYLSDATSIFRSKRVDGSFQPASCDLSFIGEGSGVESDITEDGNWFIRAAMLVYEYRFVG